MYQERCDIPEDSDAAEGQRRQEEAQAEGNPSPNNWAAEAVAGNWPPLEKYRSNNSAADAKIGQRRRPRRLGSFLRLLRSCFRIGDGIAVVRVSALGKLGIFVEAIDSEGFCRLTLCRVSLRGAGRSRLFIYLIYFLIFIFSQLSYQSTCHVSRLIVGHLWLFFLISLRLIWLITCTWRMVWLSYRYMRTSIHISCSFYKYKSKEVLICYEVISYIKFFPFILSSSVIPSNMISIVFTRYGYEIEWINMMKKIIINNAKSNNITNMHNMQSCNFYFLGIYCFV